MEGSEVLALKWNNHQSIFYNIICGLRSKERYTDATLACEGKFFPVHKLVLSTCSEYFSDIFERTPCKNPVVILKDIRSTDLGFLLDYMYRGEVNVRQNELSSLIKAAECLRVKGLAVPDEEIPQQKSSNKTSNSRQKQSEQQSPLAKRRKTTDDRRSFNSENNSSPEQTLNRSGSRSNTSHSLEGGNTRRDEETSIPEQRISPQNKDVKQSERLNPVIKLEQEDNYEALPNQQDIYDDPQYLAAVEQSCGSLSSRGSRPDKEKLEVIEDDMDPNFSDILKEENLVTGFTPLTGGNLETWDGGQILSSHTEILTAASNNQHNPLQQHHQKATAATALTLGLLQSASGGLVHHHVEEYMQGDETLRRDYVCSFCKRTFSHRTNLQAHLRIHTGEKPFHCLYCSYRTALKGNLKMHIISRHRVDWKSIKHMIKPQPTLDTYNQQQQQQQQEGGPMEDDNEEQASITAE